MKTMKNYHDFYIKYGVLLLANVFEKFNDNILKNYRSCPSHCLSTPALSYYVMLGMTKVELDFISDGDMYLFFDKGRDGKMEFFTFLRDAVKSTIIT